MPHLEDDRDGQFALRRVPGRFYLSSSFPSGGADNPGTEEDSRMCRYAYQVVDEEGEIVFQSDKAWEVVLRETPTRQQLKALFFEDDRAVQYLSFQRFNAKGEKLKQESFVLSGLEARTLGTFLSLINSQSLDLAEEGEGLRLLPGGIEAVLADVATRTELYRRFLPAIQDLLEADVDAPEIVAFARRRQQLQVFDQLLRDPDAFAHREPPRCGRLNEGSQDGFFNFSINLPERLNC